MLYFALIGLILFLLPAITTLDPRTLTGYVITTLYLMGPLAGVMTSISLFGRAEVALLKVEHLGVSLAEHSTEECPIERPETAMTFDRLELVNVLQ